MDWHVIPRGDSFGIRRAGSGRTAATFPRRHAAIKEAIANAAQTDGRVYIHNAAGEVLMIIPTPEKVCASVHIYDAPDMTAKGRRQIAAWLRKHAAWLEKEGSNYSKRFRGRYFCAA